MTIGAYNFIFLLDLDKKNAMTKIRIKQKMRKNFIKITYNVKAKDTVGETTTYLSPEKNANPTT